MTARMSAEVDAALGQRAEALETPAIVVDLDVLEHNLHKMQAYCDQHRIAFRPHVKTHKIPQIAQLQRDAGATGIVCQKLTEAEVFADAGFDNILVPFNLVGPSKTARLVRLAQRVRVSASVDSGTAARGISDAASAGGVTVPLLIECDTGGARAGVQTPEEMLELAQTLSKLPGVRFEGLMTFPTHPKTTPAFLDASLALLKRAGLEARVISGGGTPQSWSVHEVP